LLRFVAAILFGAISEIDYCCHSQIMKKSLPLIRLSSLNPFLIELKERGLDISRILVDKDLPPDIPASGELFVSPNVMYQLVEESGQLAHDPFLGYSIGRRMDLRHWTPMARAAEESRTVSDLLGRFVVYSLDHSSSTQFFLNMEGERTTFGFRRIVKPPVIPAHNDAFYLGLISKMLSRATGATWNPSAVLFEVAEPEAVPESEDGFRVVKGNWMGIRVSFPAEWQFLNYQKSAFRQRSAGITDSFPPESLLDSVHVAILPHLHEPNLRIDRAAAICGYKQRKLAALLRAEGTTVGKEISKLRARQAQEKLTSTNNRISEIARSVGIPDATVFSRAFKNWTGQSPQEYRKNNGVHR